MVSSQRLLIIKIAHTIIWAIFVALIFYVLHDGVVDNVNFYTWVAIGLVLGEGLVLVLFGFVCPLTILARRYSDSTKDNFDIFLPNWLAKWNKVICIVIFVIALIIVAFRTVM